MARDPRTFVDIHSKFLEQSQFRWQFLYLEPQFA